MSNIAKTIFAGFLLLTLSMGGSLVVSAEEKPELADSRPKKCDDRNFDSHAIDEERSTGGCTGTVPTPEPVTILLFSAGLAGVGFAARRRLRRSESE